MASKMLTFVTVGREMPAKRPASGRRRDFREIYARFDEAEAATQAGRCSQCGVPFCQVHCPVHNNIPDWLKLAAEGRLEEAYEVSSATNNFPEICGRICPQDRLCEGNCVIEQSGHGTVTIGAVERYITDTAWEKGWVKPATPRRELPHSIGIIGAGPAGLAAAEQLRRKGYKIVVYDRHDRAGGLMIYGIPSFKLEKEVVQRRAQLLSDAGVGFELEHGDRPRSLAGGSARPPRRGADRVRRLQAARHPGAGRGAAGHHPRARLSHRQQPRQPGRRCAGAEDRPAQRQGQECRRHRRRRHGHGLRAHRRAPGRAHGEMPLPPRPHQYAGLPARGRLCRGGRRGVRLPRPARGLRGRCEAHRRQGAAHPSGAGRCDRPPGAPGHRGLAFHAVAPTSC